MRTRNSYNNNEKTYFKCYFFYLLQIKRWLIIYAYICFEFCWITINSDEYGTISIFKTTNAKPIKWLLQVFYSKIQNIQIKFVS